MKNAVAMLVAAAVAVVAFLYRFNTLGGALGGFDNDHFVHFSRAIQLLHGEQPLRDFMDAGLQGGWPSLTYYASAWAQQIWGDSLLGEAYLTVGALAVAAAATLLTVYALTRRLLPASAAAALVVVTGPKLYNYPKVLVTAVAAGLILHAVRQPSRGRLALLGVWTAVAALFRHDYAVYVGAATLVALAARPWPRRRDFWRALGLYVVAATLCFLPALVWIERYTGVATYLRDAMAMSRVESRRTDLDEWPAFTLTEPLATSNLVSWTYYAFWAAIPAALGVWWLRRHDRDPNERAFVMGLLVMAAMVNAFFLRGNLPARFGDAAVPVAILWAWIIARTGAIRGSARSLAWALPALLLASVIGSVSVFGEVARELDTGGLSDGPEQVERRYLSAKDDLRRLPPREWAEGDEVGTLVAARYLAECTATTDRVLVATYAADVTVFSRRFFAAGLPTFALGFYTDEPHQVLALQRLGKQSVPVVLTAAADEYASDFAPDYPLVARYLEEHYAEVGVIDVDNHPRFRVLARRGRDPVRTYRRFGLPCFR